MAVIWLAVLCTAVGAGDAHSKPVDSQQREVFAILTGLAAPQLQARRDAAVAAGHLGWAGFAAPLLALLARDESPVAAAAAAALGELAWPPSAADLERRIAALGAASQRDDPAIREAALWSLGAYPVPQAEAHLQQAKSAAPDSVERARARMRSLRQVKMLTDWLARSELPPPPEWPVAKAAAAVVAAPQRAREPLARLTTAGAEGELLRPIFYFAVREGSEAVQLVALAYLKEHPQDGDLEVLLATLQHNSASVRQAAALALGAHADERAATALAARMVTECEAEDHASAQTMAAALRQQPTPLLAAALVPVLIDAQGYARELAAFLVDERRGEESIWARAVALTQDANSRARTELQEEPLAVRQAVLLPRLENWPLGEKALVNVLPLVTPLTEKSASRLVPLLAAAQAPATIAAIGALLTPLSDLALLATVEQALADAVDPHRRAALYRLLLTRTHPDLRARLTAAVRQEVDPEVMASLLADATSPEPAMIAAAASRLRPEEDARVLHLVIATASASADPSLAAPLLRLVEERPDDETREQAYVALMSLPGPAVVLALRQLASDASLSEATRRRAIEDLGKRGSSADVPLLQEIAQSGASAVRGSARLALHTLDPAAYPAWDRLGRVPLVAASAGFGALLLSLITQIADRQREQLLLAGGGALIGGSTAYSLTLNRDISLGEAAYFASLGTWGALGGYSGARLLGFGGPNSTAPLWAAIGGELVGVGTAGLSLRPSRATLGGVVLSNAAAASFGVAALSAAYLSRAGGGTAGPADVFTLGGLAAVAPLAICSRYLHVDTDVLLTIGASVGLASWVGAFLPQAVVSHPQAYDSLAGVGVGQAVGLAGGLVLAQFTHFEPATLGWLALGAGAGASLGAGVGLALPELRGRPTYGLLELGTLGGAFAMAYWGPRLQFHQTDLALVLGATAGGAAVGWRWAESVVEGAGLDVQGRALSRRRRWGGRLLGTSVGLGTGLLLSQLVDLSTGELVLAGSAAAVLGAGAGGAALLLPATPDELFSPLFAVGAAVGGTTMALVGPKLRYEPADALLAASSTALGAVVGSLIPAYWTPRRVHLQRGEQAGGAMLGGAAGALFAGAVSQATKVDSRQVLRVDVATLGAMGAGAGLGMLVPSWDRRTIVGLLHLGAALGYAGASVTERRSYSTPEKTNMILAAGLGGTYGSLIPMMWRRRAPPGRERWGGVLVGSALGGVGGRLAAATGSWDGDDVFELALFSGLGAAVGAGAWALPFDSDRARYRWLVASGTGGWLLGELVARHTRYRDDDAWTAAAFTTEGAALGLTLPYWYSAPHKKERAAGLSLGAGLFGLAALGLVQLDWPWLDNAGAAMAASFGGFGVGAGLAGARVDSRHRQRIAWGGAGALGGFAAGLALVPLADLHARQLPWISSAVLSCAWLGNEAAEIAARRKVTVTNRAYGALAGGSLALLAAPIVPLPYSAQWAGEAMFAQAALLVGSEGALRLWPPRSLRTGAVVRSVAGVAGFVVGGSLGTRLHLDTDGAVTTSTFAAAAAWQAGLLATGLRRDTPGGILLGAAAGASLGYGLAQLSWLSGADDVELASTSFTSSVLGWGIAEAALWNSRQRALSTAGGSLAGLLAATALHPYTRFDTGDVPLLAASSLWGAWHGLWLAELGQHAARRRLGAASAGAAFGLLAGGALAQFLERNSAEVAEASLWLAGGALVGSGSGDLFRLGRAPRLTLLEAGSALALVAGVAVSPRTSFDGGDAALVGWLTALGGLHGAMLPNIAGWHEEGRAAAGARLGAGVGALSGMLLAQHLALAPVDVLEAGLTSAAGDLLGFGLSLWLHLDAPAASSLSTATGLSAAALGIWSAKRTRFGGSDKLLVLFGAGYGAYLGAWAPKLWHGGSLGDVGGGLLLGLGAGALASGAAAQLVDFDKGDIGEIALGASLSAALGAGVGQVLARDDALWVGLMEATGLAGTVLAATVAPQTTYDKHDVFFGALLAGYGLYQGAGLSLLGEGDSRQVQGAMLAAGAAGALAGTYLGPRLHLDGTEIFMLAAGSAWGLWIGGWGAAVIEEELGPRRRGLWALGVGTTAVATDVALVATSIAISRLVEMPPLRFAWINIAGGLGLVAGTATAALTEGALSLKAGNVLGSIGGLAAGTVVTAFFDFPDRTDVIRVPAAGAANTELLPKVDSWMPGVELLADEATPASFGPRFVFGVRGRYH